jgi:hypothetical protein
MVRTAALVLLLSLLVAPATDAKRKPRKVTCRSGQATLVIARRKKCVSAAKALARPSGRDVTPTALGTFGTGLALDDPVAAALVPKKLRPRNTNAMKALRRLRAKLPAVLAVRAKPAAINITPGSTRTTTGADGSSSSTAHAGIDDTETGAKGSVDATADQAADGTSSVSLDFGLVDRGGSGGSFSLTMPIEQEIAGQARCPTAAGAIDRRRQDHAALRVHQTRPGFGVDWIDQNIRYQGEVELHGHVDPTAALNTIEYSGTATLNSAYEAKMLLGAIHTDVQVEFQIKSSGTIDGRTGVRTPGETTFTGRGRQAGKSAGAVAAEVAQLLQDPRLRDRLTQLLSDNVNGAYKSLKTAEAGWQAPNACAEMRLSPDNGPPEGIARDESTQFTGQVQASRAVGGGTADGRWTLQQLDAGTQTGLPGSSSAGGAPVTVRLTATRDVDEHTVAAGLRLRVTSPAGVAELSWSVGGKPLGPPYYYRITGGSATQTVAGTETTTRGAHIDQQAPPVRWTWNFARTSGAPDGSVTKDGRYPYGSVKGGEDQVQQDPWTWRTDEQGGHTHPVAGLTTDGPTVSFDTPPGDATRLILYWHSIGIPDFQYSADVGAPDGTYSTWGPDCAPMGYGDLASDSLPLAFFAQRTFTINIDRDWNVDQNRPGLGHDVCSGHLTATMTLERVQADGSPLP